MRRREFITLIGAVWALPAQAQQTIARIGYIWIGTREGTDVSNAGLRQGLADHGYEIGRNLILEERYADGDSARVPSLISELLALHVDVLVTVGTPISLAAQRATTTVPIVSMSGNPVGSKLVASLSHPGGNITGMSMLSGDYSTIAEGGSVAHDPASVPLFIKTSFCRGSSWLADNAAGRGGTGIFG
jgi:putative ABC transport system substrate-binding protein